MSSFTSLIMTLEDAGIPFEFERGLMSNTVYYPQKKGFEYKAIENGGEYYHFTREGDGEYSNVKEIVSLWVKTNDRKNLFNALMESATFPDPMDIDRVIFSPPATIVKWLDGTKTVVKADEEFDKEKGLAMCIAKKALGNKGNYYEVFKYFIED